MDVERGVDNLLGDGVFGHGDPSLLPSLSPRRPDAKNATSALQRRGQSQVTNVIARCDPSSTTPASGVRRASGFVQVA